MGLCKWVLKNKQWLILGISIVTSIIIIAVCVNIRDETDITIENKIDTGINNEEVDKNVENINDEVDAEVINISDKLMSVSIVEIEEKEPSDTEKSFVDIVDKHLDELNIQSNTKLTKFEFNTILYKIILDMTGINNINQVELKYTDLDNIPNQLMHEIVIITSIGVWDNTGEFNGYKYISNTEVDRALQKYQNWLNTINVESEKKEDEAVDESNNQDKIDYTQELDILVNRKFKDRLFGNSVAKNKKPRTLGDIKENIENIASIQLDENFTASSHTEYINIDEGAIGQGGIQELNFITIDDIVGMTRAESVKLRKEVNNKYTHYYNDTLLSNDTLIGTAIGSEVLLISNYSIIGKTIIVEDTSITDRPFIRINNEINVDTLGLMIPRSTLDGKELDGQIIVLLNIE